MKLKRSLIEHFFDDSSNQDMMPRTSSFSEKEEMVNAPVITLGWVKPDIITSLKGISKQALDKKRKRGQLLESVHWGWSDGVIYYNYEAINAKLEHDALIRGKSLEQ